MTTYLVKTPEQLGAILRGYRREVGMTQQALAERLGVAQKAVSLAETHPEKLSVARLFQLLGALGVELSLGQQPKGKPTRAEW